MKTNSNAKSGIVVVGLLSIAAFAYVNVDASIKRTAQIPQAASAMNPKSSENGKEEAEETKTRGFVLPDTKIFHHLLDAVNNIMPLQ
ncbi:MAG: hypothetical protein ACOYPR_19015 [Saprospiraceae bacterium]|jgi:hypothetical protein